MDHLDEHLDAVLVGGQRSAFVELAEPDSAWEMRFLAHRARLLGALGARVSQLEPAANVHLHNDGDPQLADRLRLRDLLCAEPAALARYEQVKRALTGRVWPDVNHYAEAKSEVIAELLG